MLHLLQWEPFKHLLLLFSLFFSASSFFKATLTNPKVFRRREANPQHTSLKQKLRTTEVEMKAKTHQQRGGIWWRGQMMAESAEVEACSRPGARHSGGIFILLWNKDASRERWEVRWEQKMWWWMWAAVMRGDIFRQMTGLKGDWEL